MVITPPTGDIRERIAMEPNISSWTIISEELINVIGKERGLPDRVMRDVLEWYTQIGICMIDILGSLYNQEIDDLRDLAVEHDDVIRPLWAAMMYYTAPRDQKWIWKDEAFSLVMPFSLFSEAMHAWMDQVRQVECDHRYLDEIDEDEDEDGFWH